MNEETPPLDKAFILLEAVDDKPVDHTIDQAIALAHAYAAIAQAQALVNVADAIGGIAEFQEYVVNRLAEIDKSLNILGQIQRNRL